MSRSSSLPLIKISLCLDVMSSGGMSGGGGEFVGSSERAGLVERRDDNRCKEKCTDCIVGCIDCNCIPYALKLVHKHQTPFIFSIDFF